MARIVLADYIMTTLSLKVSVKSNMVVISLNDIEIKFRNTDLKNNIFLIETLLKHFNPDVSLNNPDAQVLLAQLSLFEEMTTGADFKCQYILDPATGDAKVRCEGEMSFNLFKYISQVEELFKSLSK